MTYYPFHAATIKEIEKACQENFKLQEEIFKLRTEIAKLKHKLQFKPTVLHVGTQLEFDF